MKTVETRPRTTRPRRCALASAGQNVTAAAQRTAARPIRIVRVGSFTSGLRGRRCLENTQPRCHGRVRHSIFTCCDSRDHASTNARSLSSPERGRAHLAGHRWRSTARVSGSEPKDCHTIFTTCAPFAATRTDPRSRDAGDERSRCADRRPDRRFSRRHSPSGEEIRQEHRDPYSIDGNRNPRLFPRRRKAEDNTLWIDVSCKAGLLEEAQ